MAQASPVSPLQLVAAALYLAAWPGALLLLGGDPRWIEAWIFAAWFFTFFAVVIAYLYVRDPALLAERHRPAGSGGQSVWDRVWVSATLVAFIGWIAVIPLDARRFHWLPFHSLALELVGGALLAVSSFLVFRAFPAGKDALTAEAIALVGDRLLALFGHVDGEKPRQVVRRIVAAWRHIMVESGCTGPRSATLSARRTPSAS